MYFITYLGEPFIKDQNISGAYINCYIDEDLFETADNIARKEIKKLKWKLLTIEDSFKLDLKSITRNNRKFFNQALIDKFVLVFHTYPEVYNEEYYEHDLAVFTTKFVIKNNKTVTYVSHDQEDGAWQFFSNDTFDDYEKVAKIVGFNEILEHDPTIKPLKNLEMGFCAIRKNKRDLWKIKRIEHNAP